MIKMIQILTIISCIGVNATEIELVDKATGKVVAKIDSEADSEVTIDGKTYITRIKTSATESLAKSLKNPDFKVENLPLEYAVEFLKTRNKELASPLLINQQLNIIIFDPKLKDIEVSLNMQNTTFHSILTSIAELLKCEVSFETERVVFREKKNQ